MSLYLSPSTLITEPTGVYSSLTAGPAITDSLLDVGAANSGLHYITYTYIESGPLGSCEFSTTDTLEVLSGVDMTVVNNNPDAVSFEACLYDVLTITVTNFTFVPTEVLFVAGGGGTISVPVSPSLSVFAGVYSGPFNVSVPDGARTEKFRLQMEQIPSNPPISFRYTIPQ
jgi:hypothetical protein